MTPASQPSVEPFIDAEFEAVDSVDPAAESSNRVLSQDEIDERAHSDARSDNLGLQRILLPENPTKAIALQVMQKSIPTNEFGLPAFFYRSDLLPYDLGTLTQQDADAAVVHLSYEEGYPTYEDGKTFWFQLPHESQDSYQLFYQYCEMALKTGIRQIQLFSQEQKVNLARCIELRDEFFWTARSRAYDLFHTAAARKQRALRGRYMEDVHFEKAGALLETLFQKIEDEGLDFFKNMTAKEGLECARLLINIQRVSSGLSQNGNAGKDELNPDASKDPLQLMKEISEGAGAQSDGLGIDNNMLLLLQNPEFARSAQALVIQVRSGAKVGASQVIRPMDAE